MRLAPVVLYYRADAGQAIRMAGESSRTTHASLACVDACRYLAALILGALAGESKETLCGPAYAPVGTLWQKAPLEDQVAEVAGGSFKRSEPPASRGSVLLLGPRAGALGAY
jgi:ADP-ribosylglycohydrolase